MIHKIVRHNKQEHDVEKLPNVEFRQMIPVIRQKGFYEAIEPREISWPEYNKSQILEATELLDFIRDEVDKCEYLERKNKRGRPLTDPKSLAKAVLMCEALGFTERTAEGWLKITGPYVGLYENLDDGVIGDAYDKIEVIHILRQVFHNTKNSNGILCGDGTGLEKSRKENYEASKKYASYMISIVDSRQVVQCFEIGSRSECIIMKKLIADVE